MNVFELSSKTKTDIDLIWKMAIDMFPLIGKLRISDKEALLRNFYLKFWIISPIMDCIQYERIRTNMKREDRDKMICWFYNGSFISGKEMEDEEILKLFGPYWYRFAEQFVPSLLEFDLIKEELIGIVWLLFFDYAYTNISDECIETCRNIRKVILKNLKNCQLDREFDETRLLVIMEVLEKL
uniref:NR LBD domain-containing protein n=1 Tax=Caenorhabditis tropicalis TaxID=1561998 RepID=A0A1I7U9P0_9PELO